MNFRIKPFLLITVLGFFAPAALSFVAKEMWPTSIFKETGIWGALAIGFTVGLFVIVVSTWKFAHETKKPRELFARVLSESRGYGWLEMFRAYYTMEQPINFETAQIWVEFNLLCPRPKSPMPRNFPRGKKDEAYLKAHINHKEALQHWEKNLGIACASKQIETESSQNLIDQRKKIILYLKTLPELSKQKTMFSHCTIKIKHGFVAPIFLLTGLHAAFDEEWKPIIASYDKHMKTVLTTIRSRADRRKNGWSKDEAEAWTRFSQFRMFQFYCWLLWGPSVPACQCKHHWESKLMALQFGFGDENNSIELLTKSSDLEKEIIPLFKYHGATNLKIPAAVHSLVSGKLTVLAAVNQSLAKVQKELLETKLAEENIERIAFSMQTIDRISNDPSTESNTSIKAFGSSRMYYSAYIWAMFTVLDETGQPLFHRSLDAGHDVGDNQRRWQDLLPFFVHGNIGSPDTYEYHKSLLVSSIHESIRKNFENEHLNRLRLRFANAFDDSSLRSGLKISWTEEGKSIRNLLRKRVLADPYLICFLPKDDPDVEKAKEYLRGREATKAALETAEKDVGQRNGQGRLIIPANAQLPDHHDPEGSTDLDQAYDTCYLPGIIAAFYRQLPR